MEKGLHTGLVRQGSWFRASKDGKLCVLFVQLFGNVLMPKVSASLIGDLPRNGVCGS